MTSVMIKRDVKAPAREAWKLLSDFGGIGNIMRGMAPEDLTMEGEGLLAIRTIKTPTGVVKERCEALDEENMMMSYSILGDAPLRSPTTCRLFEFSKRVQIAVVLSGAVVLSQTARCRSLK